MITVEVWNDFVDNNVQVFLKFLLFKTVDEDTAFTPNSLLWAILG